MKIIGHRRWEVYTVNASNTPSPLGGLAMLACSKLHGFALFRLFVRFMLFRLEFSDLYLPINICSAWRFRFVFFDLYSRFVFSWLVFPDLFLSFYISRTLFPTCISRFVFYGLYCLVCIFRLACSDVYVPICIF